MTAIPFQDWLLTYCNRMSKNNRDIALLLDNTQSHVLGDLEISYIEVLMLPPYTKSKL